jgi:hypothetical protein
MPAFDYPAARLVRIHGPLGYTGYESYRAWLRDEFAFRCVYCLSREQWGRVTGEYDLDHFVPQKTDPARKAEYDNLDYACRRCNLTKSGESVPDPMGMTAQHLRMQPDGSLRSYSADAEALVLMLDLNAPRMVAWRLLWVRLVDLAGQHDANLFQQLMSYPDDLPNLARLRPPGGNSRPAGVEASHFARRDRGELPAIY